MAKRPFLNDNRFFKNKISIKPVWLFTITFSFLLIFSFFLDNINIVQPVYGQFLLDSFMAKGVINTQLSDEIDFGQDNSTEDVTDTLNEKIISPMNSNSVSSSLPVLKGEWILKVNKGSPDGFKSLFVLSKDGKIVNAFVIHNLRNTEYIQLNDKGTEIINGKVDFQTAGLKNETIKDIDATITILGLSQIRISLDKVSTFEYFKGNPIVGQTRLLLDGSQNMLIGPPPPKSPQTPSQGQSSFYQSNTIL